MNSELKKLIEEEKIMEALAYPFYKETPDGSIVADLHWKPSHKVGKDELECVPYINGDQVRQRLNDVLATKWQTRMEKHEDRTICILSVYIQDANDWLDRSDVGTPTATEKEKGETTDSLKRAAVNWGVGAYIKTIPNVTLPMGRENGKNVPMTHDKKTVLMGDNLSNYINTLSLPLSKLIEFWGSLSKSQQTEATQSVVALKKMFTKAKK